MSLKAYFGGAVALVLGAAALGSFFTVDQSEVAVVTTWGKVTSTAGPGLNWKVPFTQTANVFETSIQELKPKEAVNTYTVDNQEVNVGFIVNFRIPADKAAFVYEHAPDYRDRAFTLIIDRLKAEMGKINVTRVAAERGAIRDRVKSTIAADARQFGLEITEFQITDLWYDKAFTGAVQRAAVEKANIEAREYERQQAEKVAQRAKIEAIGKADAERERARGAADGRLLAAKAEAEAIRLQGEATAEAIKAQANALRANVDLIELERAKRWDGKLPTNLYAHAPIPYIGIPAEPGR